MSIVAVFDTLLNIALRVSQHLFSYLLRGVNRSKAIFFTSNHAIISHISILAVLESPINIEFRD